MKKWDVLKEKMAKLGVDFEFDDNHYQKAHKDIKDLVNHLLTKIREGQTLTFTTKELEYLIYYIGGKRNSDPMASTLVGKILDELKRRKEKTWFTPKKWEVPSFEIGWFLDQGYQGRGIAKEAARRSLEFLFSDLNAHKVIAITRDTNPRSQKLAERLGFRREGHFRESRIENGKRYGLLYYGMLRTEFSSSQSWFKVYLCHSTMNQVEKNMAERNSW